MSFCNIVLIEIILTEKSVHIPGTTNRNRSIPEALSEVNLDLIALRASSFIKSLGLGYIFRVFDTFRATKSTRIEIFARKIVCGN